MYESTHVRSASMSSQPSRAASPDLTRPVSTLPDLRCITITGNRHGWQARSEGRTLARHRSLGGLLGVLDRTLGA